MTPRTARFSHAASTSIADQIQSIKGHVALIRDPKMVDGQGGVSLTLLEEWITRALERLTGKTASEAWRTLFRPEDHVAIKVNTLGGAKIATHPHVATAIAKGLHTAGVPLENILIWDRSTRELSRAGYTIRKKGSGPLCFGTDRWGYESAPRMHGSIGSCFSYILTRWATALVDVPVLKDHDLSGVSLSMKNLFGVIHNPNKYHDSGCSPYLADLLSHRAVREKLRLTVCDAHRAQCHGGPAFVPQWAWPYRGLLVGADPVALDRLGLKIIEDRRRSVGLPTLSDEDRPAVHIQEAHDRGLGEGRLEALQIHDLG